MSEDKKGCRRHEPFFDEECAWCAQADINYKRLTRKPEENSVKETCDKEED